MTRITGKFIKLTLEMDFIRETRRRSETYELVFFKKHFSAVLEGLIFSKTQNYTPFRRSLIDSCLTLSLLVTRLAGHSKDGLYIEGIRT